MTQSIAAAQPKSSDRKAIRLRPIMTTFRGAKEIPILFSVNPEVEQILKLLRNGTKTAVWNQLLAIRTRPKRRQLEQIEAQSDGRSEVMI